MATLKEFEEALRQHGMTNALAILEGLKARDRAQRSIAPARRVVGRKMTAELARSILDLHATTGMTQQEIAFKLGVNQGRVNEVIKRGKWLSADPKAPEALSRAKAMQRLDQRARARRAKPSVPTPARAPAGSDAAMPARPALPGRVDGIGGSSSSRSPASMSPARDLLPPADQRGAAELPSLAARPRTPMPRRTPADPSAPIVSAQLAFLDL